MDSNTLKQSTFLASLVKAVLGRNIVDIPEHKQEEAITTSFELFQNFVVAYFAKHYTEDLERIEKGFSDEIYFSEIHSFSDKFEEAYNAFLQYLLTR